MRLIICVIAVASASAAMALQADLVRDGVGRVTQATVETQQYKLLLDCARGARIMSLLDKTAGVELVQKDDSGLGGLFEDRPLFTECLYDCRPAEDSPQELMLGCVAEKDGVTLIKTYTFTEGKPAFGVRYQISNATQLPFRLWIRNFANPGGGPITEADHLFVRDSGKLIEEPFPNTYRKSLDAPWAAYLDTAKQSGYFVRCDFDLLDSFYNWSDSKVIPTFEWIYRPVPPGQKTSTSLIFGLLSGLKSVGNISAQGESTADITTAAEARTEPRFAAIPDWKPLEELYQPTADEKRLGVIPVVSGVPQPAPRLRNPDAHLPSIVMDLGRDEDEAIPIEIFGLAPESHIRLPLYCTIPKNIRVMTEDNGWLQQGDSLVVPRGQSRRLWLMVNSRGLKPGEYEAQVQVDNSMGGTLALNVRLTIWNVKLPDQPVIGTQFYASVPTLSSYDLDDAAKRKFLVYMDNMQALHCDNLDWAVGPHSPAAHLKVAGTGELLSDWGKAHPNTAVDKLPDLDFSYFDIWFDEPVKRHMTRFVAHVPSAHSWREASLVGAALGVKDEDPNDELSWQVMGWYYRQLRAYAAKKGFTSFWAKLDDEIPQEEIPNWLKAAGFYRAAGFLPFTTNTGNIARSEALLKEMNRESDAWQVALCLSRDFMDLTRKGAAFETKREKVVGKWGPYGNGGAKETWATKVFGDDTPPEKLDQVHVLVNGQALKMLGGSPWGNVQRGVSFQLGPWIYLTLPDGSDPNSANLEVSYRQRTLKEGGEPAVKLEPTDEVWYYGGGKYSTPYEAARAYPWRVVAWNMRGYGWWTYLWWNGEDILVKVRPETNDVQLSGAWEGLRDGNEDAAYFRLAEEKLAKADRQDDLARLRSVFGTDEKAILRFGERRQEIYAWDDFVNPTVAAYNAAKREALRVLAK